MMLVRQKVVSLVRIDVGEWGRIPEMKRSHEAVTVTAVLSDGRTDARQAVCLYEAGEREKIMEQALGRKDNEAALIATKRLLRLRSMAVEKARGELLKLYANGIVEPRFIVPAGVDPASLRNAPGKIVEVQA